MLRPLLKAIGLIYSEKSLNGGGGVGVMADSLLQLTWEYKMKAEYDPIYPKLQAIGAVMDSHESDLYVLVTPETRRLIDDYRPIGVTYFMSEGKRWADIPFSYLPYWESRHA